MRIVERGECFLEVGPGDLGLALHIKHIYVDLPKQYDQGLKLLGE
jgi:hypothetical protein